MKRLAATAITLLMTAAIGTAAASPYDHGDNRQASGYNYSRGYGDNNGSARHDDRSRAGNGDRRGWNGHDRDSGWNRYQYRYYGARNGRGYYRYDGYRGYPGIDVTYVDNGAPYYPASYAYDNAPYGYDDGYATCERARHDNTGSKLLGALVGGALGNQVGKGDGRKAATVAGAVIGYNVAANATDNRRYYDERCDY